MSQRSFTVGNLELPVLELGHIGGGHLLYRCGICGAFWERTLRSNDPIAEAEVRKLYPQLLPGHDLNA
jgi:hypothetical protein